MILLPSHEPTLSRGELQEALRLGHASTVETRMDQPPGPTTELIGTLASLPERLNIDMLDELAEQATEDDNRLIPILLRHRNNLVRINQFAPELLGLIFEHATIRDHWQPLRGFEDYPWRDIQAVCSHWRQIATNTPSLWTEIQIPRPPLDSFDLQTISLSIQRAGVLPLTVYFEGVIHMKSQHTNEALLQCLASNASRIRALQVNSAKVNSLKFFATHEATHLRSLALYNWDDWQVEPRTQEPPYELRLSQLQTLVTHIRFRWFNSKFRMLRHLILDNQRIIQDPHRAQIFLRFLGSHPQLEDLIMEESSNSRLEPLNLAVLPPVNMPCLKRVSARGVLCATFIEELLIAPEVLAKAYLQIENERVTPAFTSTFEHRLLPERKVYIGPRDYFVVTDGTRSICADLSPANNVSTSSALKHLLRLYTTPSDSASHSIKICELWLGVRKPKHYQKKRSEGVALSRLVQCMEAMESVKKVVLWSNVRFWLTVIFNHKLFPSLAELQIHDVRDSHDIKLRHFLKMRAEAGLGVETLRFVQESRRSNGRFSSSKVLGEGQEMMSQFVSRVVCEGEPLRMGLPNICTTPSPAHPHWPPWDKEYVRVWGT